ncbi:hypothetical protein Tsubulata_017622, partial [Turnera subulata]
MEDLWLIFCGKTGISDDAIPATCCISNTLIIGFDILLLAMLLLNLMQKSSRTHKIPPRVGALSSLQITSAIFSGCIGFGYLCLALWILEEKLRKTKTALPLNRWLTLLFQGCTWLPVCLTVSLQGKHLPKLPSQLLPILALLFSGIVSGLSLYSAFLAKRILIKTVLDVLCFPGAIMLLLCSYKVPKHEDFDDSDNGLDAPLIGEASRIGKTDFVSQDTPIAKAGFFSTMSFWWLNPLMERGKDKTLEEADVPKLHPADQAESCYMSYLEKFNKQKQADPSSQPSLLRIIILCHWKDILISGFFAMLKVLNLSAGPLLINAFILVSEGKTSFKYEGYVLALALFIAKSLESLSQRQWYFRSRLIGLKVRSLLTAAIYKKQLRLSNAGRLMHSGGEVMNYVAVDAYRIGEFPYWFHQTWTTSFQLCISLVILFRTLGLATFAALAVIILTVLCNAPIAKLQHKFQSKLMVAQDERLKATSEALVNMKVLKLYAWETHFRKAIENLRKVEHKWLSAVQFRKGYNDSLFWSAPVLVSAATFGACYFLKIPLHANNVFTFLATLRLVQEPVKSIPEVIGVVIQAKVAFSRVVKFLEAPELQSRNVRQELTAESVNHTIYLKCANFSWDEKTLKPALRNVCLEVRPCEKVAICGEVGSGKSTLLAAILGEVLNTEGTVYGRIAYVSQTAWIQSGTIRDNILFGSAMSSQRYQDTLERCSLVKDLELLPYGDLTEIGERGVNLSGGQKQRIQLARALYQDADIYLLDDPFSAVDAETATNLFKEYVMGALARKTVLLVTHQVDFLPAFNMVLLMADGEILQAASYNELLSSNQEFQELVNAHKETAGSQSMAEVTSPLERSSAREIKKSYLEKQEMGSKGDQLIKQEEREVGDTGLKPYIQYLRQNKGYLYLSLAALGHLAFMIVQLLQNAWMAANVDNPHVSTLKLIAVYSLIGFTSILFLLWKSIYTVVLGLESSKSLFKQLLNSLFRSPVSFYDATPLGRILSRVTSDLSVVDLDVPFNLVLAVVFTITFSTTLLVLTVITWQVLFVAIPMVYLATRLQRYYFATAKELMRINGTTKSLVANHLAESAAGAVTIRAFQQEERFFAKNLDLIDTNASPFFHNFAANEWLILRLETLSATVLASAALCMVLLPPGTFSSGLIGMALTYGLYLNMALVASIQYQCTMANYIISVERLDQYMHLPSEAPEVIEDNRPPLDWPAVGKVVFSDLQIRYRPDAPLVLRGISCTFQGGHKIGIVGRTGSGKTTLISALFRLVEPAGGKIIVDEIDISKIGLHDLRSRFGIIPQEPTLFNGTVRYNLDPLSQHTDQEIWEVLGKCQLREAVQEKEEGLDSGVVGDGSNWSMEQRQLFCLGRALLRRSRILVLDEATASIDNATDLILQKTIRTEFADCTVITVAHRIPTVMDCNMYDEPMKLMETEGSLFGQLVKQYWSHFQSAEIWRVKRKRKDNGGSMADLLWESSRTDKSPSRFHGLSSLQIASAIFNGCIGFVYLCLGIWNLEEKLRKTQTAFPLNRWLLLLFQGCTWLPVGLTISIHGKHLPKMPSRLMAVLAFLLSGIVCGLSLYSAILAKRVLIKTVLDVLCFPGAIMLVLCTYRVPKHKEINDEDGLYAPLNGEATRIGRTDSATQVTPFADAGFFSKMYFCWLNPLLKRGKVKTIEDEDIPKLRPADRAESCYMMYLEQFNKHKQADPSSQPSLLKMIILCHWKEILISGFFAMLKVLTLSAGPLLLNAFILVAEGKASFKYEGSRLIGLKVRSLLTAAIYKKQLRLSNAGRLMHTGGEIMNYVTVDAYRIGEFPFYFHQTWTTIFQLCISLVILFRAVGLATFAALVAIIITVLCNTPVAKLQHKFQSKLMVAQDERLKASSEALVNMKVLKLYAWETHFKNAIEELRKVEYKWLSAVQLRRAYNGLLFWSSPILISAATFGACYLLKIPLHANNVFTFVATLRLVQEPIRAIPEVIGVVIQAKVAFSRIVKFLEAPELQSRNTRQEKLNAERANHTIYIKSANFSWDEKTIKPALRNVCLEVRPCEKVAICGEVGSGKSTLLAAILGEVLNTEGTVYGRTAYVSQTAWIQTGTIRDNILFGSAMNSQRYQDTLERCSLVKDLELLPYGDLTEIGERGVNLSGGQKQRIQLARALYQDADIYLLDDPFSAVDAETATNLFNEYVMGALTRKTVLLVTHQVDFLPAFDSILLMADGEILQAASYHELLSSSQEFQELVNAHKETAGSERLAEVTSAQKRSSAREIKKSDVEEQQMGSKGDQLIKQEEREVGDTGLKPYIQYLCQNKGYLHFFLAALGHLIFVIGQISQNTWMAANVDNPNVTSDLSIVDLDVPFSLVFAVAATINVYSNLGVLTVVTWQVLFVSIPIVYLASRLQRYYFATAKELMRINGTTKSLVANHLAESVAGAMTIRAFEEEERFFAKNLDLTDTNASPFFHNFAANEWLIQRLETFSATVLASAALCMVLLPPGTFSSGFIGLALSYGLSLNNSLVLSIQYQCIITNYIISVERLDQYMHIPSEAPEVLEDNRPPPMWPAEGKVVISDLQIRYRPDGPLVLQGVSCTFQGGHKIGIVGRTGSGKTTLIGALFRLVEPAGGKIVVDGIDISKIGLHDLRSRFGIIPQDPTLFNGTVRYNLDPLSQHTDQEIWEVLGKCQLLEAVQEKDGGLDSWDGSNWSMGQRQLFCLGRALLRRSRILVLDEATASIDNATDLILQRTIRTEFADCTVITVAHRIPTVMDCDMVKDLGKMTEDLWLTFCGESGISDADGMLSPSNILLLSQATCCSNSALIICFDILLLAMLLFNLMQKSSRTDKIPPRFRGLSSLQIVSAIWNISVGFVYLFLGIWTLVEKLRKTQTALPLNRWLLLLFQGCTWLPVGLTISIHGKHLPKMPLRLLSILAFLFSGIVCGLSLYSAFLAKRVLIKTVLDVLCFPGAIMLLLCTYKVPKNEDIDDSENGLYAPLNGEVSRIDKTDSVSQVTPFSKAGFFSTLSFWWLNPLMKRGKDKTLEDGDIPKLRPADRAESCYMMYLDQFNKQKQADPSTQPSLLKTIILCHWKDILISGFFAMLKVLTLSAGPLLLNAFILVAEGKASFKYEGSLLTAAIYKKQLRLSNAGRLMHSGGEIMNYVTTWTTSFQLCISLVILFRAVGLATFAALVVIIITVLCNTPLAKLQHKFQSKLMVAQDERLKASSEALVNMKVLKLYAWETHFKNAIENLRKVEHKWLSAVQFRKAYNSFLFWSSPVLVSTATFGACYFLKIPLHANNVFTFVATLRLVQEPIRTIPDVIGVVIQAKVAFSRIVNFLEAPELQRKNIRQMLNAECVNHNIYIKSANFSWDENISKPTLKNVNLEVRPYEKVAICGEVGSGKSTLLAAILGEVPNTEGTIQVYGRIAYVSQTAWIQTGTIRDNILFGSAMNSQRYQDTLERCSLVKDLELLPYGDLTEIGERGVNLSGGQKQRIQLARALYQDADIYLLDDPFSAVDAETATNLFNLMADGEILRAASYHELFSSSKEFQELVNAHKETAGSERLAEVTSPEKSSSAREIKKSYVEKKPTVSKGDQLIKQEEREVGDTGSKPYIQYLCQNRGYLYFSLAALTQVTFVICQISQNSWMAANVSSDLSIVDLDVPFSLIFAVAATTNFYSNLGRYYFATAKELMRINGTTKSLVANHLAESVAGAMTIRAFEEEDRFFAKNLDLTDTNASPFFHSFAANEWLIQRLETFSATVLASAALCMYMHVPSEALEVIEDNRPPPKWPAVGKVVISDLQIRYRPDAPLVLRGISCTFEGGHKIGIVGRTGSGKTTLIGALFRLVEPVGGKIVVDGIDISKIGLHDLRSRFGIIPQDPTLFNGTVRYNLDPLSQHTDQEIWEVLGKCQLQEAVQEKEGGLDSWVAEDGSNWSMGQRQLFCLGRALLRRSRGYIEANNHTKSRHKAFYFGQPDGGILLAS